MLVFLYPRSAHLFIAIEREQLHLFDLRDSAYYISDANKDHLFLTQGVFLHILADTLGSAGVIVSAILMWAFGWMIADPICSIFIAILIAMSVWALLADSVAILMQRTPKQLDHQLADCYQRVMQLEGVQGVHEQV